MLDETYAELTLEAPDDTQSDSLTLEASGETETAVFCSPILDRIRACD